MTTQARGTVEIKTWDEKTYSEIDGASKLTRASVSSTYHGDVEGESTLEYLMCYRPDGTVDFIGFEQIAGSIGGRSGSIVQQLSGVFTEGAAKTTATVVFGTGDLSNLRGTGTGLAEPDATPEYTLDYDFK